MGVLLKFETFIFIIKDNVCILSQIMVNMCHENFMECVPYTKRWNKKVPISKLQELE